MSLSAFSVVDDGVRMLQPKEEADDEEQGKNFGSTANADDDTNASRGPSSPGVEKHFSADTIGENDTLLCMRPCDHAGVQR